MTLQRKVAEEHGVQLIYTTGVKDPDAVSRFPNIVRLDNRAGRTLNRRYIVENPMPAQSGQPANEEFRCASPTMSARLIRTRATPGEPGWARAHHSRLRRSATPAEDLARRPTRPSEPSRPHSSRGPDGPNPLARALQSLVAQGLITLPRGARAYDARSQPRLPIWFVKPARARVEQLPTPARVWPLDLESAAAQANRPDEMLLITRIADWLRNNRNAESVPMEERSLEIFDDEKTLGTESGKRLFTTGTLSLGLLRCFRTPLTFVSQHVPGVRPTALLVAENNATFHSLLTAARGQPEPTRPELHIAWGSGRQFPVAIDSVHLLEPKPSALYYFGDLDLAGFSDRE